MKLFTSIVLAALVLFAATACTTTSTNPDRSAAMTSAMLEIAGTSFAPVLANNPQYRPVAQAVAEALGTLQTGTLDADTVRAFVGLLAERKGFTPAQRAYAELLAAAGWGIYTAQTGNTVATVGDANTQAWIAAFRRGLTTAIAISTPQG
jgi:hypothetical protein